MKNKTIKSVSYNFHQTGDMDGMGPDYDYAVIGEKRHDGTPVEITEHIPTNGLERHYVDIDYEDGTSKRVFNISEIDYYSDAMMEARKGGQDE